MFPLTAAPKSFHLFFLVVFVSVHYQA